MKNIKIAVASTDGIHVNEHFGRAEKFLIYEATPTVFNLLEEREVDPYSSGSRDHSFDRERFAKVAEKLTDCRKLFVTKIGDAPATEFMKIGIEPVTCKGLISDIDLEGGTQK